MNGILYTQLMLIKILSSLVKCVNFQIFDVHVKAQSDGELFLQKHRNSYSLSVTPISFFLFSDK